MTRSRVVPSHNHSTFDVRPLGYCRACDNFLERQGLTIDDVRTALNSALVEKRPRDVLRILAIMKQVDPFAHAEYIEWIGEGAALADAVDEAIGVEAADVFPPTQEKP